jgi:PAS domain S-box-containing protein
LRAAWQRLSARLLPQLRRDSRLIVALGAAVILLIAALSAFLLDQSRRVARVSAEIHAGQLSKTVSHQLATTLAMIEHAIRYLHDDIRDSGRPERVAELGTSGQLPSYGISHFAFIDPGGVVIYDSLNRDRLSARVEPKERDFFDAPLSRATDDFFVTHPVSSSLSRDYLLPVSRAVRSARGELLGVLVAMIDVRSLNRIWSDLGLNATDSIDLIGRDDKVWLRWPRPTAAIAQDGRPLAAADRPIAVQVLGDWGLKIAASIDQAALERQMVPAQVAIVVVAVLTAVLVGWFFGILAKRTQQAADDRDIANGLRGNLQIALNEVKQREEQLAAEMERLTSVFQSSGAVILMLDREACVVLANQAALDLHRGESTPLVGRCLPDLKLSGLDAAIVEQWQKAAGAERLELEEFECRVVGPDGNRHLFRFTANPVQDETGALRHIVLIGVDDTRRRAAEVRLFDVSRLANLGEMATGIAHEINQPLAIIRIAADSLRDELKMTDVAAVPPDLAQFLDQKLERIAGQTDRAASIIRDLRSVARKPVGDLQPFDLAAAVRVSCDLMGEQLRLLRIDYQVDAAEPGPLVVGEASRIQQVVINLVLNARDALTEQVGSGPGLAMGAAAVNEAAGRGSGPLGRIVVRVAADQARNLGGKGQAVLTVEDNGPGIPADVRSRLFEPFFTTKPVGKGTGLGLSISNEIVRGMGGEISAETRAAGGACFRVVLPLAARSASPASAALASTPATEGEAALGVASSN